ncbi:ATP-binding cassette domain-containing protein [Deinococcus malanensis]|uniref:ATP-binding cassette domain-containing protein n=1 Tax=Deinococcus malanensis TaxID=1706855 RepID=UPI00363CD75A
MSLSASPPYALQLRDVWLRLGREVILRGVTLDVPVGEGVTLLGENGAGKTTLLRLLASGLRPTRGEGRVMNFDLRDSRAVRDFVHLMPVDAGLYPDLTCTENLEFALRMHGQTGDVHGALRRWGSKRYQAVEAVFFRPACASGWRCRAPICCGARSPWWMSRLPTWTTPDAPWSRSCWENCATLG